MAKTRIRLACAACGHVVGQWVGRCPGCGEWGSISEAAPALEPGRTSATVHTLGSDADAADRLATGIHGLDRALGGGLVRGSVVLLAGQPGIGKSTLLLQVVHGLSATGRTCLVASGEESAAQVGARAARIGVPAGAASFVSGRDLPDVVETAGALRPDVLIVDSIQAIRDPEQTSLPGGPTQVRACADALVGLAKERGVTVILAGQVTKDGDIAGPRTLEHAVDAVLSFDADSRTGLRVLAGGKNRFGPEGEVAWFEMGASGLREVDPARALAPSNGEAGAASALVSVGRRAVAIEIQALVSPTEGPPRRHVSGLDPRRFGLVAAVMDRHASLSGVRAELYGASAGGLRIEDPGCDLAIAAALASALSGRPPPRGTAFVGEVSLTGSVRAVPNLGPRLAAAAAARIGTVYVAEMDPGSGSAESVKGVRIVPVRHIRDALGWTRSGASGNGSRRVDKSVSSASVG